MLLRMLMRRSACTFAIGNLVGGGGSSAWPTPEAASLPTRYRLQVVVAWRLSGTEQPVTCRAAQPWADSLGSGDVTSLGSPLQPRGEPMPGPTVVLVHGAFADASGFAGVIRELESAGHTVLAPPNPLR